MRLAYIITAHKYPEQLERLIRRLNADGAWFFVHVDKKTDAATYRRMTELVRDLPNVRFAKKRYPCRYMTLFSAVQAVVEGVKQIFAEQVPFDYLVYLTGQDYPIKTNAQIAAFLENAAGQSFLSYLPLPFEGRHPSGGRIIQNAGRIECWHLHLFGHYVRVPLRQSALWARALNRVLPKKRQFPKGFQPFGGWAYWCLARQHVEYLHKFVESNLSFVNFFRYVKSADEIFVQTILLNSPFKDQIVNDDLRYVDWSSDDCHPKLLGAEDIDHLAASPKLFARKFDLVADARILDLIDKKILSARPGLHGLSAAAFEESTSSGRKLKEQQVTE
jgi:hypothetical protein